MLVILVVIMFIMGTATVVGLRNKINSTDGLAKRFWLVVSIVSGVVCVGCLLGCFALVEQYMSTIYRY